MSNEWIRVLLALVVLAHGIGHVLFAPMAYSAMRVTADGHSWLLSGALGKGVAELIASAVAIGLVALFAVGAYGLVSQTTWWRPALIVASVVSIALIAAYWDGLPTSSAVMALLFNGAVLVALLVLRWPSESMAGA